MKPKHILYSFSICIVLVFFAALQSCTKTTYDHEKMPYKSIESFKVKGYTNDSLNAVVRDGQIMVYWTAEAAVPATIKPVVVVSAGASISPASGVEVAFSDTTTYTVKAEDGSIQVYHLKPVLNVPIPRLYSISPYTIHLITDPTVTIAGEYFLSRDTADVKVYAQRISDGYEFDLDIDYSLISNTSVTARIPSTNEKIDTGLYKIWVKIGDRISDSRDVQLRMPLLWRTGVTKVSFKEAGQPVTPGDSVTIQLRDTYSGDVLKWYRYAFTKIQILSVDSYSFSTTQFVMLDDYSIRFKTPDQPMDSAPWVISLYYKGPFYSEEQLDVRLNGDEWPKFAIKK